MVRRGRDAIDMNLSEIEKQEVKKLIDRGDPLPERY
jgi:hypothetical protein